MRPGSARVRDFARDESDGIVFAKELNTPWMPLGPSGWVFASLGEESR
jgi:hypothetical protein